MANQDSNQVEGPSPKPKKKKVHGCVWAIGIFIVIIVLGGIFGEKSPEESDTPTNVSTSESAPEASQPEEAPPPETALRISAEDLWTAYNENEISADLEYEDKEIIVTGTISSIGKDVLDTAYVALETGNMFQNVQCMFAKSEEDSLVSLSQDQLVSIKGTCDGMTLTGGVLITHSILVE